MSDEWVDVEIGPALSSEDDEWVDVPASPTSVTDDGYLSEFFSTLFSKEGSLTDLYEGSIGGLKNTAKAFGQSSNKALAGIYDPNSDTPGIIKMAGQLGTPFEMVRNFYKGKDVEKGLLDTSKLITGAIPGADLAVDKINQALAPESFPATTAKEDARRFRREVVGPVALTGALRTFGKGANATSKAFEDAAQATKERALGIQYGDKSGGLGKQAVYLDAEGNVVPKGMATEITSSVQQKVKALEDFGFLKKASNKPSEALSQLQKQHLETELVIDNLIDKADAAVGNQSFLPEWSKTKAYFQNLRDSKQKALAPELEKITRDYALDPETGMRKIIKLKRQFSDDADFARANAPEKAELYQAAYLDLQELGERVFDAAVPQSKGAFKAANELASAEIGVTKTLPKAVARKNPGIFETLLTPTGSGYALGSSGLTAALLGNATIPGAAGLTWLGRGLYQGLKNTKPISFARTQDAISDFASLFSPLQKSGVGTTLLMSGLTDEDSNTTKNVGQEKEPVVSKQTQKPLRNSYNAPSNSANYIASSLFSPAKAEFKSIEAEIDKNPYYSALYEAESGRNPKAKNPKSTATGGFQFIKATAKSLGLDDPKDLAKSYEAVQRFTDEHRQRFGDDPGLLYAAHFLGAPLLSKVISNKNLSDEEEQQVSELRTKAMPRFLKIFNRINQNQLEA